MVKIAGAILCFIILFSSSIRAQTAPAIQWQKSLGGSDGEPAGSALQTADGGFIVAGYCKSNDGDVTGNHGHTDYWVLKLDAGGNIVWQKSLGGSSYDEQWGMGLTSDGG